ncbi:hypothetical protein Droror1_Dr00000162, partial [Drosera rotundifolia]
MVLWVRTRARLWDLITSEIEMVVGVGYSSLLSVGVSDLSFCYADLCVVVELGKLRLNS